MMSVRPSVTYIHVPLFCTEQRIILSLLLLDVDSMKVQLLLIILHSFYYIII